jgi:hypothetical protein
MARTLQLHHVVKRNFLHTSSVASGGGNTANHIAGIALGYV